MKKLILIPLVVVLTFSLIASTVFIWDYYSNSFEQKSEYETLATKVEETVESVESTSSEESTANSTAKAKEKDTYVNFKELKSLNDDTVGWIRIDGTAINYPVVQSKNRANFYLDHNFYKKGSVYGCPFVQENCDVNKPSDNVVIYGHNMNDGSMFAGLNKYTSYDFYKNHKYIEFDTVTKKHKYEVISVFSTTAQTGFRYYSFVNATSDDDYNSFVSKAKELSLYDTGANAHYGDKLITLSTCEYTHTNGRLVVVAKSII